MIDNIAIVVSDDRSPIVGRVVSVESNGNAHRKQVVVTFTNGYGASIISGPLASCVVGQSVELAVLNSDGRLDYTTPITSDVKGHLSPENLMDTLTRISRLPRQ